MPPKVLVWDWNGTILDDVLLCYEIENEMLRNRRMPEIPDLARYLDTFSFPICDYYRVLGYTFLDESYEALSVEFNARYAAQYRQCPLRAGAVQALQAFQRAGVSQMLLSATKQERLIEQAQEFGVSSYFDDLVGMTDDLAHSKVERARMRLLEHGERPENVLFLGDTDHDFAAASAVGAPCMLVTGGHQSEAVLKRTGAPVFSDFAELVRTVLA